MSMTLSFAAVATFSRKVHFDIPPDDPKTSGYITVEYKTLSKRQVQDLIDRGLDDVEMFGELVHAIHGLGGPNGEELKGQAALDEAIGGAMSMWLVPGIIQECFEAYGAARRGNSSRRR